MASARKGRALPTLRTLVLFFWCPFSELRDEIPTAFKQGNAGIKANDEGCFLKVLTSTQYTRLSLTHTPLLQTGPGRIREKLLSAFIQL